MKQPVKWQRSFRYAYEGIKYALSTQRNMKFHFAAALSALTLAVFFHLPKTDILFLLLAVTLVIVTELINTAIEKTVDLAMPDLHPLAKIAKDVAAASVLVTAAFAAITGFIVFAAPVAALFRLTEQAGTGDEPISAGTVWLVLTLVLLAVIALETTISKRMGRNKPSLLAAVAFAAAALTVCLTSGSLPGLLAYFLAVLLGIVMCSKKRRSIPSVIAGAAVGSFIAIMAYYLYQLQ